MTGGLYQITSKQKRQHVVLTGIDIYSDYRLPFSDYVVSVKTNISLYRKEYIAYTLGIY